MVIRILYQKGVGGIQSERDIEPVGCYFYFNNWYLIAYCRLREDYRTFKVNRIQKLHVMNETFHQEHISLNEYINKEAERIEFQIAVVRFDDWVVEYARGERYVNGFIKEVELEGQTEMTFMISSIDIFARWLIAFTNSAKVVSPHTPKEKMKQLVDELCKTYA